MAVPNALPTVSRRRVLVGTAALVLFGGALPGCSSPPTRDPALDVLIGQLGRARSDSALAAAAAAIPTKLATGLASVASIRDAHAQALTDEILRTGGTVPTQTATSSTGPSPTSPPAPAAAAPTIQDVVGALQQSADGAAQAAVDLSGYRAGLLASIAAACTTASTVALAA
ncbi:MAG: hypothetical protein WCE30_13545 [Mycobacterium sp.]